MGAGSRAIQTVYDQHAADQELQKTLGDVNEQYSGSRTVGRGAWIQGKGYDYVSSLTGQHYASAADARADEARYKQNPGAYKPPAELTRLGLGEQAPVQVGGQTQVYGAGNPTMNPGVDVAGGLGNVAGGRFDKDITNPALNPAPKPVAPTPGTTTPAPGFTDQLGGFRSGDTRRTTPAPVTPSEAGNALTIDPAGLPGGPPMPAPPGPGDPADDINREQIDKILGGLTGYQNDLYAMSQDNTGQSEAEAQLAKAHLLATQRGRDELAANQAGAMGAARGARNRGDRALLERQAIGEQAYLGSQAQRQQKNLDDQIPLDLAILRAKEEDADRAFRFQALKAASDLGLNTAALEVDISKADLDAATNWVNQQFGQLGLDKQINLEEGKALLGFTRDMAALQFEYDKLTTEDQNAADALLMQKYGIDQTTMVALKQIKEAGEFKWDQFLAQLTTSIVGGVGSGATAAIAKSDVRAKHKFRDVSKEELDELLSALSAQTWEYTDGKADGFGRRLGPMAQELERTRLGKAMVTHAPDGTKMVDTRPLALATASGLALVHERLAALEGAASGTEGAS